MSRRRKTDRPTFLIKQHKLPELELEIMKAINKSKRAEAVLSAPTWHPKPRA
jgi:hypothetical protein